ncbi:hypothetical protein K438DRAFT_1832952 [Mycena galopus ATCC 62051]|nr:hypothetical protein K438DRAFT_1832952 [Mycena galopus ATCC 62051]
MTTASQLGNLSVSIGDTVSQAKNWRGIRQTDSFKLMIKNLNSLAMIVTFLAAVQAQAISFTFGNNETGLHMTCNAFFFGGLFIDVLSGAIAILGVVQLQSTYGLIQHRETSLANINDVLKAGKVNADRMAVIHHIRFLMPMVFSLLRAPRLWNTVAKDLEQSAEVMEQTVCMDFDVADSTRISGMHSLSDYWHATNSLAKSRFRPSLGFAATSTVPLLVIAGLCCFTVGVGCFVLYSQPLQVWATSFGLLGDPFGIDLHPTQLPFDDA